MSFSSKAEETGLVDFKVTLLKDTKIKLGKDSLPYELLNEGEI